MPQMRLRTRLNLVIAGLSAVLVVVSIATEIQSARASVREEVAAANRVASQFPASRKSHISPGAGDFATLATGQGANVEWSST